MSSKRRKPSCTGEKNHEKHTLPKKERWLFTRKTWKYMQDAGRKLVPDGKNPNNPEEYAKIEDHFNKICKNESKFLVWRRKSSFPESIVECRSRKNLIGKRLARPVHYEHVDQEKQNQFVIDTLEQYLETVKNQRNVCETVIDPIPVGTAAPSTSTDHGNKKPGKTYTGAKLGAIPKAPGRSQLIRQTPSFKISLENLNKKFNLIWHHHHNPNRTNTMDRAILHPPELDLNTKVELVKCIKYCIKNNKTSVINSNHLRSIDNLFRDYYLLEQFLLELKQDKMNSMFKKCILKDKPISASMSNLDQIQPNVNFMIPKIKIKYPSLESTSNSYSVGVQTDLIAIRELKQWYTEQKAQQGDDYNSHESDNDILDERDDHNSGGASGSNGRRKSSIDNEDVSESVSNTIKRYLKMARKKPNSNKDDANRFKRINYDRNLRNIKTKNKNISILAIDTDTNKGCQTENFWIENLLHLYNDRNPHKIKQTNTNIGKHSDQNYYACDVSQLTPLPKKGGKNFFTGLLTLSASNKSNDNNMSNQILASTSTAANQLMQKSKSSSNVGHLVSKKIWKTRSKSQSRAPSTVRSMWTPQGNGVWTTPQGKRVMLTNTKLQKLTEAERKMLHRVAIEKLQQLNYGINVSAPDDLAAAGSGNTTTQTKPKHRTLLLKRKALTTGFFDIGKDKEDKPTVTQGLVFGLSLEQCINNDRRFNKENQGRVTHNSFNSLIDTKRDKSKLQTGSCESLPTISTNLRIANNFDDERGFSSSSTLAIMTSLSQSDLVKATIMDDYNSAAYNMGDIDPSDSNVPLIVTECIRHLERYGLKTTGLFRVSSSRKRVRQLREDFDRGLITKLDADVAPHDVATLLKEFLRDLPEPLLCQNLYTAFVKTQKIRNRRLQLESLSHLVQLLPVTHRDTLFVILKFLAKVAIFSQDVVHDEEVINAGNKMDSNNLATVFAPNILRCPPSSRQSTEQQVEERLDVINIIRTMIDHYEDLFTISSDLLDEIYTTMMDVQPDQLDNCFELRNFGCEIYSDQFCQSLSLTPSEFCAEDASGGGGGGGGELRKIYSRENLLHGNAMIGPNVESTKSRHKDRTTKMKYQDSGSNTSRHREYTQQYQYYQTDDEDIHSKNTVDQKSRLINFPSKTRSSSTDSAGSNMPFGNTNFDLTRRMSSPLLVSSGSQGAEILTASLQIPVQVQQTNSSNSNSNNSKLNVGDEYYDIPYIEEGCITTPIIDGNSGLPTTTTNVSSQVTGLLSLYDTNADQQRVTTKTITLTTSTNKNNRSAASVQQNRKLSQSSSLSKIRLDAMVKQPTTLSLSSPTTTSSNYHQFEPKITASITNIGDAVMKSKTADFEKKFDPLMAAPQSSMSIHQSSSVSAIPSTVSSGGGGGGGATLSVKRRPGQMYKRQEIISSVQTTKK